MLTSAAGRAPDASVGAGGLAALMEGGGVEVRHQADREGMAWMSEELLLHIMCFVPVRSLCTSCRLVCRKWLRISRDGHLWFLIFDRHWGDAAALRAWREMWRLPSDRHLPSAQSVVKRQRSHKRRRRNRGKRQTDGPAAPSIAAVVDGRDVAEMGEQASKNFESIPEADELRTSTSGSEVDSKAPSSADDGGKKKKKKRKKRKHIVPVTTIEVEADWQQLFVHRWLEEQRGFRNLKRQYEKELTSTELTPRTVMPGLSDSEVEAIQASHGLDFPPDLRRWLQTVLPVNWGFPNWRTGTICVGESNPIESIHGYTRRVIEQAIFAAVSVTGYWPPYFGSEDLSSHPERARERIRALVADAPALIPVDAVHFIPANPLRTNLPLITVRWWLQDSKTTVGEYLGLRSLGPGSTFPRGGSRGCAGLRFWEQLLADRAMPFHPLAPFEHHFYPAARFSPTASFAISAKDAANGNPLIGAFGPVDVAPFGSWMQPPDSQAAEPSATAE